MRNRGSTQASAHTGARQLPSIFNPKETNNMAYDKIQVPATGEKIQVDDNYALLVPNKPIIPYIEGDGTGVD